MTRPLLARLSRLLAGPRLADEESTRVAGILHIGLVMATTLCLAGAVAHFVVIGEATASQALYVPLAAVCLVLLAVLHRGHVRLAGLSLLLATWAALVLSAYETGGVRSNASAALVLLVIAAALLFGRRTLLGFILLGVVTLTAALWLDLAGLLPPAVVEPTEAVYASRLFSLLAAGTLLYLVVHNLQGALERARTGEARAEQVLREAQGARAYADNILASMAESLAVLDARGRIQTVNRATLQLLGARPEQLLGQPFTALLPDYGARPEDRPRAGQEPTPVERTFRAPDGREVPVLFARTDLLDEQGKPVGAVCVASDITHLKRAEASLREAKELAEEANLAKSRFLANMSHELRTPLNAVIGYAEMLIEESDERGLMSSIDELKKIQFAGKHLLGLISDILDLSKIEAGRMDIHLETFDVADMVQTVVGTIRPVVDRSGNRLAVTCPDNIGFIHADLTKIRQILLNLLSNAVKFTDKGEIRLTVGKTLQGTLPAIQFMVADTGIGMTQQQLGKLFQAFTQGDSSTARRFGGTGLGLAISKAFCDMLGGSIDVKSQLGVGTVFTVRLPYTDPQDLSLSMSRSRSGFFPRGIADAARAAAARAGLKDDPKG